MQLHTVSQLRANIEPRLFVSLLEVFYGWKLMRLGGAPAHADVLCSAQGCSYGSRDTSLPPSTPGRHLPRHSEHPRWCPRWWLRRLLGLVAVDFCTPIGKYDVEGILYVVHGDSVVVNSHLLSIDVLSQLGDDV